MKSEKPVISLVIGRVAALTVNRDVIHIREAVDLKIEDLKAKDVGGDVIHVSRTKKKPKHGKKRRRLGHTGRALLQCFLGAVSVGGMVAASGIAHALGWG